jgi:hypothetical protein
MDDSYGDAFPATVNCDPHFFTTVSSETCAWAEGFADWMGVATFNSRNFVNGPGSSFDVEGATWGTPGWSNGVEVEGRVAGVLLDLSDGSNEGPWDRTTEGAGTILHTLRSHVSTTFVQFWNEHRRADGFPVDTNEALATVYQNAIFMGFFHDFLPNNAERVVPNDGVLEGYTFNTDRFFWSVGAVRSPDNGSSSLLWLWDDPGANNFLTNSQAGAEVNFIAIDSNAGRRPFTDYFMWMHHLNNGTPGQRYRVELAQTSSVLFADDTRSVTFGADDVAVVFDTFLSAGQSARFLAFACPVDVDMFIMGSDPADPATHVRTRGQALATAARRGVNLFEDINPFIAPTDGFFGVVLVNQSGTAGTCTVQRFG